MLLSAFFSLSCAAEFFVERLTILEKCFLIEQKIRVYLIEKKTYFKIFAENENRVLKFLLFFGSFSI